MSFFSELKRRNVFRVGIAYVIVAWLLLQVADLVLDNINAPDWVMQVIMLVVSISLPLVLILAWAFELTPEGLKKEKDIKPGESVAPQTGQKLNITIAISLVLALSYIAWDKFSGPVDVQPITEPATTAPAPPASQTLAKPAVVGKSIAVLPFANRSNLEDDMFFTDGIHDDLLTQLTKISGLKVISRTSMMAYRDTTKQIPEIAAELGVATILEGGIQRAGNRVRINAQLIDVASDEHLWAETYDREMTVENLFDIQSDITRQIVAAVKLELTDEQEQSLASLPTNNLKAYEALLRARAVINRADYNAEKFIEALPWAERAVELDPNFVNGWAMLTEIHGQLYWIGHDYTPERIEMARQALDRTLELGRETAAGHAAQAAWYYRIERDFQKALVEYEQVLAITPNDTAVLIYAALTQRRVGLWQESFSTFKHTLEIDPANVWAMAQMSDTLLLMKEWSYLDEHLDAWIARFPDSNDLKTARIITHINLGELPEARALLNTIPAEVLDDERQGVWHTRLLRMQGDYEGLLEAVDPDGTLRAGTADMNDSGMIWSLIDLGVTAYLQGEEEQAQSRISNALQAAESWTLQNPDDAIERLAMMASCQAYLGQNEAALKSSRELLLLFPLERDHLVGSIFQNLHTFILAKTGHRDEALERMAANIDAPEGFNRWVLYLDPVWDFFRDDERFNALVKPDGVKEQ
jgi:TolB-like protein